MQRGHSGFLLINKPAGITSHDVIDKIRKITGERTVGHAGTLDPFATGLLFVAIGRESTKHLQNFVGLDKDYEADIVLGKSSTTLDTEGDIADAAGVAEVSVSAIEHAMSSLTGEIEQIPPMHSAIKINGKKLYELARQGKEIERPARHVTVSRFGFDVRAHAVPVGARHAVPLPATITVAITCSSGTYIRALARDLGVALGTKAYLSRLNRTRIGNFSLKDASALDELTPQTWFDHTLNLVLPSEA